MAWKNFIATAFAHEVSRIMDHKLLVAIFKKDVEAYHTGSKEYYCKSFSTT